MKRKTSISVSANLLKLIDALPSHPSRSEIIEEALVFYFKSRKSRQRDKADLDALNLRSRELNEEASDVLGYQSD